MWHLFHLRRRVLGILDEVVRLGRDQRKIRKQLVHFARAGSVHGRALAPQLRAQERIAAEYALLSAAPD